MSHEELMAFAKQNDQRTRLTLARLRPITAGLDEDTVHGIRTAAAASVAEPREAAETQAREGRVSRLLRLAAIALGVAHIAR